MFRSDRHLMSQEIHTLHTYAETCAGLHVQCHVLLSSCKSKLERVYKSCDSPISNFTKLRLSDTAMVKLPWIVLLSCGKRLENNKQNFFFPSKSCIKELFIIIICFGQAAALRSASLSLDDKDTHILRSATGFRSIAELLRPQLLPYKPHRIIKSSFPVTLNNKREGR